MLLALHVRHCVLEHHHRRLHLRQRVAERAARCRRLLPLQLQLRRLRGRVLECRPVLHLQSPQLLHVRSAGDAQRALGPLSARSGRVGGLFELHKGRLVCLGPRGCFRAHTLHLIRHGHVLAHARLSCGRHERTALVLEALLGLRHGGLAFLEECRELLDGELARLGALTPSVRSDAQRAVRVGRVRQQRLERLEHLRGAPAPLLEP